MADEAEGTWHVMWQDRLTWQLIVLGRTFLWSVTHDIIRSHPTHEQQ